METSSNRPAPVELPTNTSVVATMKGKAVREGGFWVIKGKWSMGWNHPVKSDFHYRAAGFSPDSERPYCGRYEGWFSLIERGNRSRRYSEKSLEMSFTANSEGGYNIEGTSVTEFAATRIVGLVAPDKKVRFLKMYDGPSGAPLPQPAAQPLPVRAPARKPKASNGRRKANDVWARCKKIMDALSENLDKAFWFNEPWEKTAENFPDYRSRIEHPMDFPRIKLKLRQRKYKTPLEFAADVRLTFNNAKTYHPMESHPCHRSAVELSKIFEDRFTAVQSMPVPPPPVPRPKAAKRAPTPAPKPAPVVSTRPAPKEELPSGIVSKPPMTIPRRVRQDRPSPKPVSSTPTVPKTRPKQAVQSNHDWEKEAMQIIRFCLHDPDAAWFRHPVPSDLRGYTKIIKRPMDFSTLKSQLRAKKYATMDDFMTDARLIFSNAMTFNRRGEPCYVAAEKVLQLMEQKYRDLTGERNTIQAAKQASPGSRAQKPPAKVEVEEQGLTVEEKERLEEDVGLLEDADIEKILDMITESGQGANEDGEVDLDKLTIPLARKIQAFVKRCLHPELCTEDEKLETDAEKDSSKEDDAMEVETEAVAENGDAAKDASNESESGDTEADSHAMRGKTVDAPPVKVPADHEKPDSAKTDREHSPRDSPSSPVGENPRVGELPRQNNLFERVASQIDGDRTSSSDEESEEEEPVVQSTDEGSSKRKRSDQEETVLSKKAKVDADTEERSMEVEAAQDSEGVEKAHGPESSANAETETHAAEEEPAMQRNPSLSSWISSAAKFDEKVAPKERLRADSLDQDSQLWADSQKKSEELKTIEKIRREEEEERKALLEKKRNDEERARLKAAEERKEKLRLEEERLEKQKQQEVEERTRLAREGAKDAPKVNLDEDENLLEEFL